MASKLSLFHRVRRMGRNEYHGDEYPSWYHMIEQLVCEEAIPGFWDYLANREE